MKFAVMVLEGPYQHQAADTAYYFVKAALARGHQIVGIFLFADGVQNANRFINPPGERNIGQRYEELAAQGIKVVACTSCAISGPPTKTSATGWPRPSRSCESAERRARISGRGIPLPATSAFPW